MDIINAIILGIIEGITEFLPISSTGHLILANKFLAISESEFIKSFDLAIQLGAILAVVAIYWRKVIVNFEIWKRIIVAFIPTAIIGLLSYKLLKQMLGSQQIVLWALFLGGILILLFEKFHKENGDAIAEVEKIPLPKAAAIGVFQSIAIIPGVSRSAATILGGLFLGLKREAIVEFSFLLAVPTMAAATGYDLYKNAASFTDGQTQFLIYGFLVSFLTAWIAIKWLIGYVQKHNFNIFGWYRIILAIILFFVLK